VIVTAIRDWKAQRYVGCVRGLEGFSQRDRGRLFDVGRIADGAAQIKSSLCSAFLLGLDISIGLVFRCNSTSAGLPKTKAFQRLVSDFCVVLPPLSQGGHVRL